ncbi:alpha/beta hydrolase [Burkholderia sp. Nafp2/4-1b]|uniref:alpha/beta hydrolase n=1 Tax=Burkholderia sp. Nafp2/4-1b TaxID=2116686 RepID=UPI000EF8AC6F|nr:alpha/beta hydrolase [Burkholderia sp. Nafp2/4-1b]RKU04275.1 alpha/beta hydrolase [Burkholderia sp. Nafp2/4-1b]
MASRTSVEFLVGDRGQRCRGWLYEPHGEGPFPVIVMAHGIGGIKEMRLDAFAQRFCASGYACLVFDYRHFGDSDGWPRQLLDINRQLEDWSSAIAFVRGNCKFRQDQVVLWGTSFGGGHVIFSAARDRAVAAAIAQCPFTDGVASLFALNWRTAVKVSGLALWDVLRSLFGMSPVMLATAGPPGSAALMTARDALDGYLALVPAGTPFRNQVAARIGLNIVRHRPGRKAGNISCPVLFCVCETDSVAPPGPTKRYAKLAPRGEVRSYQAGHFDIYVGKDFEQVVSDQLEFLRRHIPTKQEGAHVEL